MACHEPDFDSATHYPEIKAVTGFKDTHMKTVRSNGGEPNGAAI